MESVLITGSARRVGALIAEDLASAGYCIWIHYRSHKSEAEALCTKIRNAGGKAETVQADLTDTAQIDSMLQTVSERSSGSLTTLINNAAVIRSGRLQDTSADDWDTIMNTNLKAVWYLSTRFSALFPSAKRIITIGDASVSQGYAGHAVYGLSKYALKYLTEQMAAAFAPSVRVNLISPGFVLRGEKEPSEIWENRVSRTLTDNSGITGSILSGIRFLMTDPGMTGAEIIIDNGAHLPRSGKI